MSVKNLPSPLVPVQLLRLSAFNVVAQGSIPGLGTKVSQGQHSQKRKKKNKKIWVLQCSRKKWIILKATSPSWKASETSTTQAQRNAWGIAEPPAQGKRTMQNVLGDFEFSFRKYHDLLPFCYYILHGSATQSCPTLCSPMDCSLPGSSVHGILQAGILGGQPFPSPGDLSDPGIEPASPASAGGFCIGRWKCHVGSKRDSQVTLDMYTRVVVPLFSVRNVDACPSLAASCWIKTFFKSILNLLCVAEFLGTLYPSVMPRVHHLNPQQHIEKGSSNIRSSGIQGP